MTLLRPPYSYPPPREQLLAAPIGGSPSCNGAMPRAEYVLLLAEAMNHLLAWGRVIPAHAVSLANSDNKDEGNAVLWRTRYRAGPNGTRLRGRVALAPATTVATAPDYSWDAGGTPRRWEVRAASPVDTDVVPATGYASELVGTSTANTVTDVALSTDDNIRVCGWSLWEPPIQVLDTASDVCVDYLSRFAGEQPIYDADVAELLGTYRKLYEQAHKHLIAHVVDDGSAPLTRTTASLANLLDQSVTTYGADTPGWPLDVRYCVSASQTEVPVTVAIYASCPGGTGEVDVSTSADNTSVAVTAEQWYEVTLNADAQAATEKLDIMFLGDGANPCKVWAVSAWIYLGA